MTRRNRRRCRFTLTLERLDERAIPATFHLTTAAAVAVVAQPAPAPAPEPEPVVEPIPLVDRILATPVSHEWPALAPIISTPEEIAALPRIGPAPTDPWPYLGTMPDTPTAPITEPAPTTESQSEYLPAPQMELVARPPVDWIVEWQEPVPTVARTLPPSDPNV